jgi:DNA-binding MarR family transcriptional regulator
MSDTPPRSRRPRPAPSSRAATEAVLRHWREAVPDDRLAHLVKDALRSLSRALQIRLAEHGVSYGHWTFLRILWVRDGLTQRELSEQAGLQEPTTFSALKAMEKQGYVVRRQNTDNRRKVYIHLTQKGLALRDTLVPVAEDINRTALEGVSAADIAATRRTLLAVIQQLAEDELGEAGRRRRMPSTREMSRIVNGGS